MRGGAPPQLISGFQLRLGVTASEPTDVRIELREISRTRFSRERRHSWRNARLQPARCGSEVAAAEQRVQRCLPHDGEDRLFIQALLERRGRVEHGEYALGQ